jgi:excisionase family DNA binding protein
MANDGSNTSESLWTVEDVAAHLKVPEGTVNQWVKVRSLPVVKVGRLNRFRRSEIDAWVAEQNTAPAETGAER